MQVVHSTLINPVVTIPEGSLIACSHTMFHHKTIFKSVSRYLTKTVQILPHVGAGKVRSLLQVYSQLSLQRPALFIIHIPVWSLPNGKKLYPLVMMATSCLLVSKWEVINELYQRVLWLLTNSGGMSCSKSFLKLCFCNCIYVSVALTSWFSVVIVFFKLCTSLPFSLSFCSFSLQVLLLFFSEHVVCYTFMLRSGICYLDWEISGSFTAAAAALFINIVTNVLI